jgi:hypothetical protein
MLQGQRFLNSARIAMIIMTLAAKLDLARPLRFLNRVQSVNAFDDEIIGRFTGQVFAADIIADDQEAVTYEAGKLELVVTGIPNVKLGSRIPQAMLNRMASMTARGGTATEENAMTAFENRLAENLVLGVRQRQNALVCAMMVDDLVYDRFGVKIIGSFGTPADLKATPVTPWTSTSATPITDIQTMVNYAATVYGQVYNRFELSQQDFLYMVKTTEFKNQATALYRTAIDVAAVNTGNIPLMRRIAGDLLNMTIEIEDATYNERQPNGKIMRKRVLPEGKVLLSNSEDDNNQMVMDLANGIVTESLVAGLTGNAPEGLGGEQFGPLGYYTGRPDLNPPDVTGWGVARCFPRKHVPEATAVLTVR